MPKTTETKSYQLIINEIQARIVSGELKCGDKLPSERTLTGMFGLSRTSVREALKSLEMMGIVEKRHGEGNFIVNNTESSMISVLSIMFTLNRGNIDNFMDFRNLIELGAAKIIIVTASDEEIRELETYLNQYTCTQDLHERTWLDMEYHKAIVRLSNNPFYIYTFNAISALMAPYLESVTRIFTSAEQTDGQKSIDDEHNDILSAISSRDYPAAEKAISSHLKLIQKYKTQVNDYVKWGL